MRAPQNGTAITKQIFDCLFGGSLAEGVPELVERFRMGRGVDKPELLEVAGVFLEAGSAIGTMVGPAPVALVTGAGAEPVDAPLAVIVGRTSASAAEVLAGALQYHARALVLGDVTYGKGLAHNAAPLGESGWVLMMPVGQLETPDGRKILGRGIEPDVRTVNPVTQALARLKAAAR